jgi:putative acyl-CoA dehydrogenase
MNTAWMTHQISNQFDELENYNLFETDTVLQEILTRYGSQDQARLTEMGKVVGSAEYYDYADLANRHTPIYMPSMHADAVKTLSSFILHGINGWG